jgi:hypothetical protein
MACPSDETFTRLVEGLLPEDETRALEAHADGCLTCAQTLAELARAIAPSGGAASGLLGDRYRLLEPLGAGGMGVVYAAFDTKLSRKVAIKRLRETGAGTPAEKRRGRFLREAQLLASLSHPNVLTVHDVGGADRELYVVMELVDGAAVSRWLAEARPGWRAIVDVFLQAGRGLVAAHQLGIVHRDIKPDNILVAKNGRVLVGDFGLAGLAGNLTPETGETSPDAPSPPTSLTQTGTVLGTPAYMSPEQHDGKTGDALSDQFSFAVSLYESLHGRRPFAGRTASEIAAATRSGALAPGGDGVPRAIDRVLATALQVEPGRRYASMEDLLAGLERARARRPVVALVAGLALVVAASGAGVRIWSSHGTPTLARTAPPSAAVQANVTQRPTVATPPAAAPDGGHTAAPATGGTPPAPRSRRRLAQSDATPPAPGPAPSLYDAAALLSRASNAVSRRDGAGCLALLREVRSFPPEVAARALETRADCELLAGHCDAGRRLLEQAYADDRRYAGVTGQGLLGAHVSRMCPAASFPTVEQRILAVSLQASSASSASGHQAQWCGALKKVLLAETRSKEVAACLADVAANKAASPCHILLHNLEEGYRYLTDCFLRDNNCREGARLDVMHSQVEWRVVATDNPRAETWCRPTRVIEVYPSCSAAGKDAERTCKERLEAARQAGLTKITPEMP